MAQSEGFKHITVTASEDEDVVILAGAASGESAEEVVSAKPAAAQPEAPDEKKAAPSAKSAPKPVRKRNDYREATLDDLKPAPMPVAQRIVIIAAVICIIGAVIYCLTLIR